MSMEIKGNYENSYLDRLQNKKQEEVVGAANDRESQNGLGSSPTPKDEYISSEKSGIKPSGLYRMGQDENGNPKVLYDDPESVKLNL